MDEVLFPLRVNHIELISLSSWIGKNILKVRDPIFDITYILVAVMVFFWIPLVANPFSSSVIDHLETSYGSDPHIAVAYFYFSFRSEDKQNTENMLKSLIVQLCGGRPDTPQPLSDLQSYRDKHLQPSLEKLEKTLQACVQDFNSVYLVFDALDECPRTTGEREKLLKLLGRVQKWSFENLHVLYTSRPEPDITAELLRLEPTTSVIDLEMQREEMRGDIRIFIDKTMESSNFSFWPPETKNYVKAALVDKADGMYTANLL
jgi:hypothetical protein